MKLKIIIIVLIIVGGAAFYYFNYHFDTNSQQDQNSLTEKQKTEPTKYKNITFEIDSGWSETEQFHVVYPITENESINNQVKDLIDKKRDKFDSNLENSQTDKPDLNVATEVNFATDDVVLFEITTKDNTLRNSSEVIETRFYDRQSGNRYEIDSFFDDPNYLERLSQISRKTLPGQIDSTTERINKGTEPKKENFNNFGIKSEEEMFIDFEPGQVAPISQGIITMPLKISDVEDILSIDFEDKIFPGYKAEVERAEQAVKQAQEASSAAQVQSVDSIDCNTNKCVALSFDDGPSGSTTPELLKILDEHNVKATFFMIGSQVAPNASLVKEIADKGHVIGNHTWDHKDLTTLSASDAKNEIERTNQAISSATGIKPYLVRPPYGAINDSTRNAIGYATIEWSVDPEDWKNKNADIVYDRVVTDTTTGSVVLSHDIHPTTIEAYRRIVPKLLEDGFTLVTVPQLFGFNAETIEIKNYFSR